MPIYEYECAKCHKVHEIIQKFSDPPLGACPECGSGVTKRMSLSSFALKGQGWYSTDYKSSSSKAKGENEAHPEAQKTSEKPEKTKKTNLSESIHSSSSKDSPNSQMKKETKANAVNTEVSGPSNSSK